MASPSRDLQRLLFLGLLVPIGALNVFILGWLMNYFRHLVTLVTLSAILAFLLDYPVRFFERVRVRRIPAVMIVLLITVAILAIVGLTLIPIVVSQMSQLFKNIPDWLNASRHNVEMLDLWAKSRNLPLDLEGFSLRLSTQVENQLKDLAPQALGIALGTVSGFVDTILVIVLASYMLLYGEQLWAGLMNLLPPKFAIPFSSSLRLNFHNFFLSQVALALFMVVTLIPIFFGLQVPFALLFALLIGIAELIPFIGAALGIGSVSLLVLFQDFWMAFWVMVSATILQQIRDNLIAPKIMGDFTGLNPIWIIISLLIGLQVGGILGVFIAVPIAGTIKCTIDALLSLNAPTIILDRIQPTGVVEQDLSSLDELSE
ncbi:MAG: AI-2E family transporter [Alkalinema sp. CACIAM 70d]|nr:MAG: AI-2E family transporter [Alkalinema sp. CACIAM 70d]